MPDPSPTPSAALHPDVAALGFLLGTWSGHGTGSYPTIEPFEYEETVTFGHVGKPFLAYQQRTVRTDTGLPAHAESGYLRSTGHGDVELILAHPTGITELAEGTIEATIEANDTNDTNEADGGTIALRSVSVVGSSSAKPVRAVERTIAVDGDRLHYVVRMSAVGLAMTHHLEAELVRIG